MSKIMFSKMVIEKEPENFVLVGVCTECDKTSLVSDCEEEDESDYYDSGPIIVHPCPYCEEGILDDYHKEPTDTTEKGGEG